MIDQALLNSMLLGYAEFPYLYFLFASPEIMQSLQYLNFTISNSSRYMVSQESAYQSECYSLALLSVQSCLSMILTYIH